MKEIVLDTNVLIRLLIKDVPSQFKKAQKVFEKIEKEEIKGLVSVLVINEAVWILENYYELERKAYIPLLLKLLLLKHLKIIEAKKSLIIKALQTMEKQKFDFTDVYLFQIAKTKKIFSFDKDFQKMKKK
ncbi:PIN domain-containing protein [Candidatus Microgenomates bacterium]|nr:PIN domain-containing protein [Candidatus Microgenomates bacterium]